MLYKKIFLLIPMIFVGLNICPAETPSEYVFPSKKKKKRVLIGDTVVAEAIVPVLVVAAVDAKVDGMAVEGQQREISDKAIAEVKEAINLFGAAKTRRIKEERKRMALHLRQLTDQHAQDSASVGAAMRGICVLHAQAWGRYINYVRSDTALTPEGTAVRDSCVDLFMQIVDYMYKITHPASDNDQRMVEAEIYAQMQFNDDGISNNIAQYVQRLNFKNMQSLRRACIKRVQAKYQPMPDFLKSL